MSEKLRAAKDRIKDFYTTGRPWTNADGDDLSARLTRAGLIEPRQRAERVTVKAFTDAFLADRAGAKANSLKNYRQTVGVLLHYLPGETAMDAVDDATAKAVAAKLYADYAEATGSRHVKFWRQIWTEAIEKRAAKVNPFLAAPVRSMDNPALLRFIPRADIDKILTHCPDDEWRLIVCLARYGGLRVPSELAPVKWSHIDWQRSRFTVHSPKTGVRVVPLFPDVRAAFARVNRPESDPGSFVIGRAGVRSSNLRTTFTRIVVLAGLKMWPKPFQNLRASCETELAAFFPIHVVTKWLGNSPAIAAKHYLQITEENFAKAAGQNPRQHRTVPGRTETYALPESPDIYGSIRPDTCTSVDCQYTPQEVAESQIGLEIVGILESGQAESEAFRLTDLAAAWWRLSDDQKARIARIVREDE